MQQNHQAGGAGPRGAEMGPRVFHMLSEMDHRRFKGLPSSTHVKAEIEFPRAGLQDFPQEV